MDGSVVMALEYTPTPHKKRNEEPVGERHEREVGYCVLDIQRRPWTGARPWLSDIRCSYGVDAWRMLLRRLVRESVVTALEIGSLLFARLYEELEPSTCMYALWLRDLEHLCAT